MYIAPISPIEAALTIFLLGRRIYPPRTERDLRELHKRISDAPITPHFKQCLIFYLLKDLSPSQHKEKELATQFAQSVHLSKPFWTFIDGIWELDHLQYDVAVGLLTHPSIIPTFPDEILHALLNRRETSSSLYDTDFLPLAYYNCAKPPLANDALKTQFVKYMATRNVTETYYWIRARPEYEHTALLEALFEQTLDRANWAPAEVKERYPTEDKAMELVSLPFSEEEERWLENFLTEGKGRTLRGAEDTVLMRRLATGQLREFTSEKGTKGRKYDGLNWETLKDGVKRGLGPRQESQPLAVER